MSKPLPPSPPGPAVSSSSADGPPKRRRRWLRWLLAITVLLALVVVFLPNIVALPFFRQRLLNLAFSRLNTHASVGELSLSWFSPVVMDDLKLQPEDTDRAAVTVPHIAGDISLGRMLWGHSLGGFRITQPELFVHFDSEGTNITRLVRGLASLSLGNRGAQLEIVDGRLLLQGQSSPQPWPIEGMNLNLTLIPAAENTAGVPILHGQQARLMNQVELTPEMCNDLLKFITPPLFQATRTSGKVSLELDEFNWPLGKPDAAQLTGRLTLHSVEVVPGPVMQLLNSLLQNRNAPLALQIAKDDEVSFHMHDGRVYHENLTFRLAALQVQMLIHSHGSVGLDESLDWFIEFQFPGLDGVDLAGHPFMKLLSQKPTLHIIGTLSQPKLSPEGLALQALQTGIDMLRQPAGQGREQPQQGPAANPGGLNNPTSPPPAKP